MVRDLIGTMKSQKAGLGLLILMKNPTKGMAEEAKGSGSYTHPILGHTYPQVPVITVDQLLAGDRPDLPTAFFPVPSANAAPQPLPAERSRSANTTSCSLRTGPDGAATMTSSPATANAAQWSNAPSPGSSPTATAVSDSSASKPTDSASASVPRPQPPQAHQPRPRPQRHHLDPRLRTQRPTTPPPNQPTPQNPDYDPTLHRVHQPTTSRLLSGLLGRRRQPASGAAL